MKEGNSWKCVIGYCNGVARPAVLQVVSPDSDVVFIDRDNL